MQNEELNIKLSDLEKFDEAPAPDDALRAFDAASGQTVLPVGEYVCKLESGELVTTSTQKQAYRLRFSVLEPAAYAALAVWKYLVLNDAANANRAKAALAPLGVRTSADLKRAPFPEANRQIICRVTVGVQKNDSTRNDVLKFTVERDERDDGGAAARFALPPDAPAEGGTG